MSCVFAELGDWLISFWLAAELSSFCRLNDVVFSLLVWLKFKSNAEKINPQKPQVEIKWWAQLCEYDRWRVGELLGAI